MYKKKILSLSAAVAVLSTGALAFDTDIHGNLLRIGSGKGQYVVQGDINSVNNKIVVKVDSANNIEVEPTKIDAIGRIKKMGAGEKGDVLIFPAFFGGLTELQKAHGVKKSNWSSEFSVINTSDEAVIAKVVLYGKIASEELRDFNIYLSAHDVFRAELKNGRLISHDGSTVAEDLPTKENLDFRPKEQYEDLVEIDDNNNYKWDYDAIMASKEHELNITIDKWEEGSKDPTNPQTGTGLFVYEDPDDGSEVTIPDFEHEGYIVVYAMIQAETASYHKKGGNGLHKELWEDYRHLLDTCRNVVVGGSDGSTLNEWHNGIEGGIYLKNAIRSANIYLGAKANQNGEIVSDTDKQPYLCNTVYRSEAYKGKNGESIPVKFKSPEAVLTGSILVSQKGDDGRGTRAMLLKAFAIDNFTDDSKNQALLWTEGEFAHLADRCIYYKDDATGNKEDKNDPTNDSNGSKYNKSCVEKDAEQLAITETLYEYTATDPDLSKLLVTQPYKRVLIGLAAGDSKEKINNAYSWYEDNGFDTTNKDRYGSFDLTMKIYDDDENSFAPTLNSFIVSPATAGFAKGIKYEVSNISIFATMNEDDEQVFKDKFDKGYAIIKFPKKTGYNLTGIVTQMSANVIPTESNPMNAEVNWIYPLTK